MSVPPLIACAIDTPFGDLHVVASPEDDAVRAAGFGARAEVLAWLPARLTSRGVRTGAIPAAAAAVDAWLAGDGDALATVPVAQDGGPFSQEVWSLVREVPAGSTATYGEIARLAGRPRAARAVGTACARTAIFPFVPCHRIVSAAGPGRDAGFRSGLREAMLALEAPRAAGARR
ncbi:methylated-DNA--[protein]-cysteine S-methyltransferase [Demequina sp. SYSU T00039]|uniref:Methylated-DNA--[protein]-cysteine S-methyltransferase n=1 Tax=Demequina lignilytica TaxID=3051663 RepID=A0AAW7M644_9MICO|nr:MULTISPECIES: methylated-DNA--[protein]-cysteine S-methyltransferase [unclassified Demequina]MDN4478700.1 methylated-DNA--[protein]-cysteine S-methyltransferase [Demequina sp. SYSU T00039-1]MDN4488678.1 methylated-DNA--[protein]-cysteine S-methyltransferase [Demequina sp. SYSU T00039]